MPDQTTQWDINMIFTNTVKAMVYNRLQLLVLTYKNTTHQFNLAKASVQYTN